MNYSEQFMVCPDFITDNFLDGDELGWAQEFDWLWSFHATEMARLLQDVITRGFLEPVVLGHDWRVWDGHHRIGVATALHRPLPVIVAGRPKEFPTDGYQESPAAAFVRSRGGRSDPHSPR